METETIETPVDQATDPSTGTDDAALEAEAFAAEYADDGPPVETPTDQISSKTTSADTEPSEVSADPAPATEPEYVQITKAQLADFEDGAKTAREQAALGTDSQLRKVFGKVGNLEELFKGFQEATPAGQDVVVSEEDFEEVRTEHELPELASSIVKGLNRVFAKAKLKGTAPAPPPEFDPSQFETAVNERVEARLQESSGQVKAEVMAVVRKDTTEQLVSSVHSDWKEYTPNRGANGGEGSMFKPFSEWVAAQGSAYAQKLNDSWDPGEISAALTTFKASQAPPPKQDNSRADQLREGVTPRGAGAQHTAHQTVEEAADEGYRTG